MLRREHLKIVCESTPDITTFKKYKIVTCRIRNSRLRMGAQ